MALSVEGSAKAVVGLPTVESDPNAILELPTVEATDLIASSPMRTSNGSHRDPRQLYPDDRGIAHDGKQAGERRNSADGGSDRRDQRDD